MYLESFKRPRRFVEMAKEVTRNKPVIFLKGGSTARGARAAVAHTAALATDDRITDAALRQAEEIHPLLRFRPWVGSHAGIFLRAMPGNIF